MTITDEYLAQVKRHIRIPFDADDELIKIEIEVAINNIFEMLLLIPKTIIDDSGNEITNPDFLATTDDLTRNQDLAVKHLVTTYRTNPDERIESKFIPQTKRLIERILGSELGYPSV